MIRVLLVSCLHDFSLLKTLPKKVKNKRKQKKIDENRRKVDCQKIVHNFGYA